MIRTNGWALAAWTALMIIGAAPAHAFGAADAGTSGAQFLKIAPGARPSAMGEAFAGVDGDIHAIFYNPAGLASLDHMELTGMHNMMFQNITYDYVSFALPLNWNRTDRGHSNYGVLGAAITDLSVGGIQRFGTTDSDTPTDTFGASDFAYTLSYAYRMEDLGLSLGGSAKFIDSTIDTAHATAMAVDLGGFYRLGKLGLGTGVRNVGTQEKFAGVSDPLPMTVFAGASYKHSDRLLGSIEVDAPRDNGLNVGFGAEYRRPFTGEISGAVRAGYNTKNTVAGGGISGVSFGLGLGYRRLDMDMAFIPFGDLGSSFKFSLLVKF